MKKLIFTTLAMVAFSGVAVANTVEEVEDKTLFTECENWAIDQMTLTDPDNQMPPEEAHDEYRYYVELCDSNT